MGRGRQVHTIGRGGENKKWGGGGRWAIEARQWEEEDEWSEGGGGGGRWAVEARQVQKSLEVVLPVML